MEFVKMLAGTIWLSAILSLGSANAQVLTCETVLSSVQETCSDPKKPEKADEPLLPTTKLVLAGTDREEAEKKATQAVIAAQTASLSLAGAAELQVQQVMVYIKSAAANRERVKTCGELKVSRCLACADATLRSQCDRMAAKGVFDFEQRAKLNEKYAKTNLDNAGQVTAKPSTDDAEPDEPRRRSDAVNGERSRSKSAVDNSTGMNPWMVAAALAPLAVGLLNSATATNGAAGVPPQQAAAPVKTCDDPLMAATDLRCKCDTSFNPRANPLDPICTKNPGGLGAQVGLSGEARPGTPNMDNSDPLTMGGSLGFQMPEAKFSKGNGDGTVHAGSGGALSPAGSTAAGSALGKDSPPGNPNKDYNTNIITGQAGGAQAFGPGGGSNGAAPGGAGAERRPSSSGIFDKFNLSKFLPRSDKNFLNRAVNGMSVPSTDGVTSPTGPSLWEKNTRAYQLQDRRGQWIKGSGFEPAKLGPPAAVPAGAAQSGTAHPKRR